MTGPARTLLPLLGAALLLQLALILPDHATGPPLPVSPELPVLLIALVLGRAPARWLAVAALSLLALHKLADLAMTAALGRRFNIAADLPLLRSALELAQGTFGTAAAVAALVLALLAAAGIAAALWWAAGVWSRRRGAIRRRLALAALLGLMLLPLMTPQSPNLRLALDRTRLAADTLAALHAFRRAAALDPMAGRPGLLQAIDRDVLVIFVESYGRTSFDTPYFAATHLPTLRRAQAALSGAGLATASGFLRAPTQGGQSWLSHATFASGLWIDDQARYQATLASGRAGLFHHAQRAGFRTAAVMPAITRPWPEAAAMGFDQVLAAADLGYHGLPFNWVTMPDQFTLAAADRLLRQGDGAPLFAQVVLISSHAPWVPVPRLIAWDRVGDGAVFNAMAVAGPSPQALWRDQDAVRRHYRDAVDYALQTVTGYALRHAADPPLMIVLGDHQPAVRIGLDQGRDVPMHLIGPAHLVDAAAGWGFVSGLIPDRTQVALPMDRMRDLMLVGLAKPPPPG